MTRPVSADAASGTLAGMFNALDSINRRNGLAATHELLADGADAARIRRELSEGTIQRVRQGWYAVRGLHPELVRAARVGGRLGCCSALSVRGVWVRRDGSLHVSVAPGACRLRSPDRSSQRLASSERVVVHWTDDGSGQSRLLVDQLFALAELCSCTSPELVAASADSLLHGKKQTVAAIRSLATTLPAPYRSALAYADGVCESGIETVFWSRMRRFSPRRQVRLAPTIRVDFLFGERLVVEADGKEFHSGAREFEADRHRDATLSTLGYRVLRFSYQQVLFEWSSVEAAVQAAIARGDRY